MTFAPVLIPTLNRHKHLRKCLESLSRCTWANQTEVYVALDYPPINEWDKYAPDWEKNRDFLLSIGDFGFKKLHLIERTENYGTWKPGDKGNSKHLHAFARENYDNYIITEDDNIFSPCFLDYMNKGFELFEEDSSVISIVGYRHFYPIKYSSNSFFFQGVDYNAWGVGYWSKKEQSMTQLDYLWFRKRLTIKNLFKVFKINGPNKVITFLNSSSKKWDGYVIDQHLSVYCTLECKYQVMPVVSLVKNIGMDETGASFGAISDDLRSKFELADYSTADSFNFVGKGTEFLSENQKIYRDSNYNKIGMLLFVNRFIKGVIKLILS